MGSIRAPFFGGPIWALLAKFFLGPAGSIGPIGPDLTHIPFSNRVAQAATSGNKVPVFVFHWDPDPLLEAPCASRRPIVWRQKADIMEAEGRLNGVLGAKPRGTGARFGPHWGALFHFENTFCLQYVLPIVPKWESSGPVGTHEVAA